VSAVLQTRSVNAWAADQDLSALAAIRSTERVWRYAASLGRSAAKCRAAYYLVKLPGASGLSELALGE